MPSNSSHKALQEYIRLVQSIVGCVAGDVCNSISIGDHKHALRWSRREPIRLRRHNKLPLLMELDEQLASSVAENSRQLRSESYIYSILDTDGRDLIGFHYHPNINVDPILHPHVHIHADADPRFAEFNLHKRHIPSGRVALVDVIRWLISKLHVRPLRAD